jgi:hypothetical protein
MPRMSCSIACLSAVIAALTACTPYDPALGEAPFRCAASAAQSDEPLCPAGYHCVYHPKIPEGICSSEAVIRARPDAGWQCAGGDEFEPNDYLQNATVGPIPTMADGWLKIGLEICPHYDVDLFRLKTTVPAKNISVELETVRSTGELALDLLNSNGDPITLGVYNDDGTMLRAQLNNAPVGAYFVRVVSADARTPVVYNLNIETSGP